MKSAVYTLLLLILFGWLFWVVLSALWRWATGMRKAPRELGPGESTDDAAAGITSATKVAMGLAGVLMWIAAPTGLTAIGISVGLLPVPLFHLLAPVLMVIAGACGVLAAAARLYAASCKRRAAGLVRAQGRTSAG